MKKFNKLLFITTSSLSTNPRLVKELSLASNLKDIKVIAFKIGGWAHEEDNKIINKLSVASIKLITATRNPLLPWFFSTVIQQAAIFLSKLFKKSLLINSLAHNKRTTLILLHLFLNSKKYKSSFIICHTLGALYPGYKLAKKTGAKLAFDMEDYHPGELIDRSYVDEKKRREEILRMILPECDYVSFATDGLFYETIKNLAANIKNPTMVYNSFPSDEFIEPIHREDNKIKFVWFSQTIGRGRGLELFFEAIKNTDFDYEITLIGNFNDKNFEKELKQNTNLIIIEPLPQKELHKKLSEYDVGLSLELSSTDLNRNYALTNKLFAYLQAGLFVLATDTPAQKDFMVKNSGFGILCGQTPQAIFEGIYFIRDNIKDIRSKSIERYNEAKKFAWEYESKKLIEAWENILN